MDEQKEKVGMVAVWKRWAGMHTFRLIVGLLIVFASVLWVTEPAWFVAAADALRIPYAIFLVVFTTFFFIRSNYFLTIAGGIGLLLLAPGIWPYFKTSNQTPAEVKKEKREVVAADFTVLHFNVKENNKKIWTVAEAALASNADIVSMQELHPSSFQIVDSLMRSTYPYVASDLSVEGFGLAVFSKFPIHDSGNIGIPEYPILSGSITIKNRDVVFIAATTSTPTNEKAFDKQAKQFALIAEKAKAVQAPLIVMGDMNSVPWSEQIKTLQEKTGLKDSRKDLEATYPAQSPLQIPIDFIFHSDSLFCEKSGTVAGTTSNHLGIMAYFSYSDTRKNKDLHLKDLVN